MVEESMDQGLGRMARGRVDYNPGLFVQDDDGIVLKENLQGKSLRLYRGRFKRQQGDGHHLARLDFLVLSPRLSLHVDHPLLD
jgi:hypothetical protein